MQLATLRGEGQRQSILLAGLPGTGKSMLVRALAAPLSEARGQAVTCLQIHSFGGIEYSCAVFFAELSAVVSKQAFSIVCLEDFEKHFEFGPPPQEYLLVLKREIGQLSRQPKVLLVANTCMMAAIDAGVMDLFVSQVNTRKPDAAARRLLWEASLKGYVLDGVDFAQLAQLTVGYTHSEIRTLVQAAISAPRYAFFECQWLRSQVDNRYLPVGLGDDACISKEKFEALSFPLKSVNVHITMAALRGHIAGFRPDNREREVIPYRLSARL